MNEQPIRQEDRAFPNASGPTRTRRLFAGWSANLVQMILGITQQVALIPVFLHYWSGDILAAWLAIYAAGNLVLIADAGLQFRTINRFLGFKSGVDCDGRTACFYASMLQIYLGVAGVLLVLLLAVTQLASPAAELGFQAIPEFDTAFMVMIVSAVLALPSDLASALYRARGLYGRAVQLRNWGMLLAQLGQLAAVVATGSLLAVTIAYAASLSFSTMYMMTIDAPRQFPFLGGARVRHSWSWIAGQFRRAAPFAVAGATELALLNLPVLLVSALVVNRVAAAQFGLTRVAAGLVRVLCVQVTLPLAAELGHDDALGLEDQLRSLYARGSVLITLLASVVVSGLLAFWPDFFVLWTRGTIPYDRLLTITLLIGAGATAPSILGLGYANYSNRGQLLVRTRGLQLVVFLMLSLILVPLLGPIGMALAIVASDLLIQFGLLGSIIIGQTLLRPVRHVAFLVMTMAAATSCGWALGAIIGLWLPGTGLIRFVGECTLWLIVVALIASPLANASLRAKLEESLPK